MKKQNLLWLAIAILFVLNIATLVFIFSRTAPEPQRHGNRAFDGLVIQTLQLNPQQEQRFDQLKREHHEAMMQLDRSMKAPVEQYFGLLLKQDASSVIKQQLETKMMDIYLQKLQITYHHFEQIKWMCSAEQQRHFDKLIPELIQVIQPPPTQGPPRSEVQ